MGYQGFENRTPFAAEPFLLADEEGAALLTLVAKGTWDLPARGGIEAAAEQAPIHKVPVHQEEGLYVGGHAGASPRPPGAPSLRYEHEAAFAKVAADVILLGHAQPERGRATELDVSLRVGPLRKQVRVYGDRFWRRGIGGRSGVGAPASFERMPLVYERAFGGWDRSGAEPACDPRNPVGVGFRLPAADPTALPEGDDARLPNLEDPADLLREPGHHPAPAGFGFIAPDWAPRRQLAGTFDEAWRAGRFPRLPVDFNRRHLNAAPADQQLKALRGGDPVEVVHASHRGPLRFELPHVAITASVKVRGSDPRTAAMVLDTLVIDADAHQVHLVLRSSFGVHRRIHDLEWARIDLPQGGAHGG